MHYKYYKNIKLSSDCLNFSLNLTQIEVELKKFNPNPIQVLKMIV